MKAIDLLTLAKQSATYQLDGNKKKMLLLIQATYTGYTTLYPAVVLGHLLAYLLEQRTARERQLWSWDLHYQSRDPHSPSWDARLLRLRLSLSLRMNAHAGVQ